MSDPSTRAGRARGGGSDLVPGSKSSISKKFRYRKRTKDEIAQDQFINQKNAIQSSENTAQIQEQQIKKLSQIEEQLSNSKYIQWNSKNSINDFINRQRQYQQIMERQTQDLLESIQQTQSVRNTPNKNKNQLSNRIEE